MKIVLVGFLQFLVWTAWSQTNTYTSQLVDEDAQPIPYATVQVVGLETYTVTDENGVFSLELATSNFQLDIASIGYKNRRISISNGQMPEGIVLELSSEQLEGVVVTALGIEREKQSLSSAVTRVSSAQLTEVPMTNLVNSLAGQVAGVQITNGSSGVGSSSRIVIRGENSLSGSNQPLFVIDGVPISNEQITSDLVNDGALQEVDYGNGASEISPDDIASISILKGAGSAALYGARAANGVVVITTKRGSRKKGFGVSTSSTITLETLLTLPDYQNQYGGGSNGQYSFQNGIGAGINDGGISSFGPRLDQGQLIAQFDSPSTDINGNPVRAGDVISRTFPDGSFTEITPTPWVSRPDNVRNFFDTGVTYQNNVAITSSGENGSVRLSYSNLRNEGIMPNTNLDRDGLAFSLDHDLSDKLKVKTFVNYIYTRSDNRPNLGYGFENPLYGFIWTGRQTNISSLRNYWQAGQEGLQQFNFNYLWVTNPYLTLFENTNSFRKNRILGNVSGIYDFSDKLSLSLRTGLDTYNDNREFRRAASTISNPFGTYREDDVFFREINTDVLLSYKDQINTDWKYSVSAGANRFDQIVNYKFAEASQLAIPGIYTLANSRTPLKGVSEKFTKRINSIYGTANLAYKNWLYVDATYRNDWSSTLPENNNSFGYYSVGASYVASNMFTMPDALSYLNFRASYASVGNDTDPFQNAQNFLLNQNFGPDFRVTNETVLKNANLKPERLNAVEAGLEAWLFNGRLQVDLSGYQNTSIDQIISRPVSQSSGFANVNQNGGKVRTRGFEGMLSGAIIKLQNFQWQSSVNFSIYRSVVKELPDGVDQFVTGTANVFSGSGGSNTVFFIARENGRVGDMFGSGFVEVDGKTLFGANGLPIQDPNLRLLGNYNPDFSMGFSNKFSYKGIEMTVLWDWRQGGTIVSRTRAIGNTAGVLQETLAGRETGIVGDGVMNVGTAENPQFVPNTTSVSASQYYNTVFDRGNEASALYSASYLKLRQVSLYYNISDKLTKSLGFQSIKLGLVGNNLLLFTENPHFDPELNAFQERNIVSGVEDVSYPSTRSFGVSVKTQF
ncbi:SusC/RagA family TonB-linked outer membrane protein [Arenibacter sp. GZD96]|uniref:SusC/RagA family TonB-linked outer membrane protein n=1 Tax=Aurantibrevibacter litoralis TaxID=3106030 RepID=UPI002B000406|nr:SusC/RagA family TonB-linked outer membrane protein [Arenibacter sp. GZD-96]MEA1786433.1 SusC/RagA family TonB-linked outer membrane protein [Arenibacter sp. GZD-96]